MTISKNLTYETPELKLAALILATIPRSSFEIHNRQNSVRKTIKITYPIEYKNTITDLEKNYLHKEASVNVYLYNRALNMIRTKLREN